MFQDPVFWWFVLPFVMCYLAVSVRVSVKVSCVLMLLPVSSVCCCVEESLPSRGRGYKTYPCFFLLLPTFDHTMVHHHIWMPWGLNSIEEVLITLIYPLLLFQMCLVLHNINFSRHLTSALFPHVFLWNAWCFLMCFRHYYKFWLNNYNRFLKPGVFNGMNGAWRKMQVKDGMLTSVRKLVRRRSQTNVCGKHLNSYRILVWCIQYCILVL